MATAYVETEVNIDLDDFDIEDIIDHLEQKGFIVSEKSERTEVGQLYSTWLTCSPETFEKALKEFFSSELDINVR